MKTKDNIAVYIDRELRDRIKEPKGSTLYFCNDILAALLHEFKGMSDYSEEVGMYLSQLHQVNGNDEKIVLLALPLRHKYFLFYQEKGSLRKFRQADFTLLILKSLVSTSLFNTYKDRVKKMLATNYFSPAIEKFGSIVGINVELVHPDPYQMKIQTRSLAKNTDLGFTFNQDGFFFITKNQRIQSVSNVVNKLTLIFSRLQNNNFSLEDQLLNLYRDIGFYHDQVYGCRINANNRSVVKDIFQTNFLEENKEALQIKTIHNYYLSKREKKNDSLVSPYDRYENPHIQLKLENGLGFMIDSNLEFDYVEFYLQGKIDCNLKNLGDLTDKSNEIIRMFKNQLFNLYQSKAISFNKL